jgi:hypothetical protein
MPFEYYGGNPAGAIAQAFADREARKRQDDMDAYTMGRTTPVSDYEAQNPEPAQGGFGHLLRGALAKVTGRQNPDDVAHAQWQLGAKPPSVGVTPSTDQPTGFSSAQLGASPLEAAASRYMRLPSGAIVDSTMTPQAQAEARGQRSAIFQNSLAGAENDRRYARDQATRQTTIAGRVEALKSRPQFQQMDDRSLGAIASDDALFTKSLDTTPKAPIMGSPEWLAAEDARARIGAKYQYHPEQPWAPHSKQEYLDIHSKIGPDGLPIQKALTDGQAKNSAYLQVAQSEDPTLDKMGANLPGKLLTHLPILGNMIIGKTNPDYQAQQNSGDRWIMQWLRATSGAAISSGELDNYRSQYIPQPGDTQATLDGKKAARAEVEKGLGTMATGHNTGAAAGSGGGGPRLGPLPDRHRQQTVPVLTPAQQTRAQSDPTYAQFLKSKGQL